jgi:FKBP-type peptidyl-prolyl cis-trans isomerase FkpA
MSVTAVPLRPVKKSWTVTLVVGIVALLAAGAALAWTGTGEQVALSGSPDQFLAWNGGRAGVKTTASGLQYQVLAEGKEPSRPTAADVVLVKYEGRLTDGKVFDAQERAPLELAAVIPGWSEGLQLMNKGAKYRFWIPPSLGYGDKDVGDGAIPANSVLVFDVELLDFVPAELIRQQQLMMQQQGMAPPAGPGGR